MTIGYGGEPIVRQLDLEVRRGETLALLGPSGSGKTSLLYAIAGFIEPRTGTIDIGGVTVASPSGHVPPERRGVGVVFQNYALWPHLDALDTVAYPLRRQGLRTAEARHEALALLDRMGIGALAHRRPAELSGGEQQRVGLARALARRSDLLLFDEPTAHLDSELRALLQEELGEQRAATGTAAVHATHDAAEALAVADRVALLREGRIVQHGSPAETYERPVDVAAARLTGPASVLEVVVGQRRGDRITVRVGDATIELPADQLQTGDPGPALALVRPEWARIGGALPGIVVHVAYRGAHTDVRLETLVGAVTVRSPGPPGCQPGEHVGWHLDRAWFVPPSGGA
ncbi:MAG: ABC transporter ATP-binding protein [Chloroflexi bacterium]|nr:ABC transporter ATP-binding protein [Chloroflexota bacterium]